jgi:hypothetical protein
MVKVKRVIVTILPVQMTSSTFRATKVERFEIWGEVKAKDGAAIFTDTEGTFHLYNLRAIEGIRVRP